MVLWQYLQNALGRRTGVKKFRLAPNLAESTVQFGDRVRIRSDAATEKRGLAGKVGTVYGQTTPSQTDVEVIGTLEKDHAVNVFVDDVREEFWFAQHLVEFLDHGAGGTVRLEGVDTEWVRNADGGWDERRSPS
jgi:hypothetical protein